MIPKKLQLGNTIGIVSPSGAVSKELKNQFNKGVDFLKNLGFKVKILFLEDHDATTKPEKIECYLSQFKQIGVFKKIKGLWIGHYNHISRVPYEEVVINVVKNYNFPILKCDDFGHNTANTTIPIGTKIKLDATSRQVVLLNKCIE